MSDTEARLAALETRLRDLEDQVAIYQLMSAYGPLVDSGDAVITALTAPDAPRGIAVVAGRMSLSTSDDNDGLNRLS